MDDNGKWQRAPAARPVHRTRNRRDKDRNDAAKAQTAHRRSIDGGAAPVSVLRLLKRTLFLLLALLLGVFAVATGRYWLLLIALPVLLLGSFDWTQRRWTIIRNYPVAGRIRWLFYSLRPFLRAYIVEDDLHGTPYPFEARDLIHARARGETDTHPFGTERDTDENNDHWIMHSIAPEYCAASLDANNWPMRTPAVESPAGPVTNALAPAREMACVSKRLCRYATR
jgi:hypothetical protein